MSGHIQITFTEILPEQQGIVIAHLSEAGFEGFEEQENRLHAFIPEKEYDPSLVSELATRYQLQYREEQVGEQNWNEVWEANFPPVTVDDFVAVRADFHDAVKNVEFEIVITPKMSFGTGHHATTYMMIRQMRMIHFTGKRVFDFGTGTGILAILAEKLGASQVVAIDNDDWSIANAAENLQRNNCTRIILKKAEDLAVESLFDIILANINKHILVKNLASLVAHLQPGGILILSGLLPEDEEDIMKVAANIPGLESEKTTYNNWLSIRFNHQAVHTS